MRNLSTKNIAIPERMMINITMRFCWLKKTNSKKSRANGTAKAATMMPIMVSSSPVRRGLSGLEIQ